jgi:hypothetical protein
MMDLDKDGKLDLVSADDRFFRGVVWVRPGNGDGTFRTRTGYGTGDRPIAAAAGDLDLDGNIDLVLANTQSTFLSVLRGRTPGAPTAVSLVLLDARVEAGRVHVEWYSPDAWTSRFSVERRTAEGDWTSIGEPSAQPGDRLLFEDADVLPGMRYGYRLLAQLRGAYEVSNVIWVLVPMTAESPRAARLEPARPNPVRDRATLVYGLPQPGRVLLAIFDVRGRLVATVVDENQTAGWRAVEWNGRDAAQRRVASGIYFARLESGSDTQVRKIVVAK